MQINMKTKKAGCVTPLQGASFTSEEKGSKMDGGAVWFENSEAIGQFFSCCCATASAATSASICWPRVMAVAVSEPRRVPTQV